MTDTKTRRTTRHISQGISFPPEEGKTKQSEADACDINNLMKQYERTGQINHLQPFSPQYGDFSNIPDYQGSLDKVIQANNAFAALPARVRSRFQNDPENLLAFLSDHNNQEEAERLGLVPKAAEAPLATPTEPAAPVAQPPATGAPLAPVATP